MSKAIFPWIMQRCAFCNRTAKLTGEHVWSDWLNSIFPPSTYFYRLKAKIVCRACNNGWMSNLESQHAKLYVKATAGFWRRNDR
jgi:hypothetical protein